MQHQIAWKTEKNIDVSELILKRQTKDNAPYI